MKKRLSTYLLCVFCGLVLLTSVAEAVCPVCTIAIGAGLESMRVLGVKDVLTGIWAGGLTVSLIGWTAGYMHKHNIKNPFWYLLNAVVYIALLAGVYFFPVENPVVKWWENCMWHMDQFLMELWYARIKRNNGGHALFPFQKVVMPFVGLLLMTGVFWAIIKLLPQYGIVLC